MYHDYTDGHPSSKLPDRAMFVADMWKIQQSINPESVLFMGCAQSAPHAPTPSLFVYPRRPAKHLQCSVCAPFDYPCLLFDCTTLGIPKEQSLIRVDGPPAGSPVLQGTAHTDRVLIKTVAARTAIASFVGAPAGGPAPRRAKSRKRVAHDAKESDRERLTVRAWLCPGRGCVRTRTLTRLSISDLVGPCIGCVLGRVLGRHCMVGSRTTCPIKDLRRGDYLCDATVGAIARERT